MLLIQSHSINRKDYIRIDGVTVPEVICDANATTSEWKTYSTTASQLTLNFVSNQVFLKEV